MNSSGRADEDGNDDDEEGRLSPDEEQAILEITSTSRFMSRSADYEEVGTDGSSGISNRQNIHRPLPSSDAQRQQGQQRQRQPRRQSSSVTFVSTVQQLDLDGRPRRISVLRRESFVKQFMETKGPPQIALLMFLIAIALGSTIGVVPAVMTDRFARLNHGYGADAADAADCSSFTDPGTTLKPEACLLGSADAQAAVSTSNLISNALTFATSSLMGSLSDEYGRRGTWPRCWFLVYSPRFSGCVKRTAHTYTHTPRIWKFSVLDSHSPPTTPANTSSPILEFSGILILGFALATIPPFFLLLTQLVPTLSPWWYYGTNAATGFVNGIAIALSCLADVLPQQYRAPGIGLLLAGFMLGFSLAPIFALFLSRIHLTLVSFLMVLAGWLCTVFVVPETLPPAVAHEARRRRRIEVERTAQMGIVYKLQRAMTRPIREMAILNRNHFFRLISSLAFFAGMVSSGDQVLLIYYLEERLAFTNGDVSLMFMIMGVMGLLSQAVILKALNDRVGEKMVVAFAFFCGAVDNCMYGLARNKRTIFAAVAISGLTGMAFPTISAIKANNVDVSEQGRIQGALYSLQALASGIGPVALRYVYGKTKDSALGPGSMFLFASCLYLVAVGIACSLPKDKANASRRLPQEEQEELGDDDELGREGGGTEYSQLASDSSCSGEDEEDYGTMTTTSAVTTVEGDCSHA